MNKLEAFGYIAAQASRGELVFPTSVNAALRLQLALDDPDCHIEDAIKMVLAEPVLAARTVALANSAAYNRNGIVPITNVRAAVMRIGYRSLQTLVTGMVVRQFGSRIIDPGLRAKAEQLWEHTAHVAALAPIIARRVTHVNPDTALFAAVVHEVGGFYLLTRADEFPGLLEEDDPENWAELCEDVITHEVMRKLSIPEPVSVAIAGQRDGMLSMPPETLLDTLLLANLFAQAASPLARAVAHPVVAADLVLDFVIDDATLAGILEESADEIRSTSAALLV